MVTLADIGAVPVAEAPPELADAAVGVPLRGRGGVIRAFAVVDAEDYEYAMQFRWFLSSAGYVVRNAISTTGKRYSGLLHRELLGTNAPETDHRNHDPLDNCRSNLRDATKSLNMQNRAGGYGRSRYRGVYLVPSGRWIARARVRGRVRHIGTFDSEQEAADAAATFRAEHMPFSTN